MNLKFNDLNKSEVIKNLLKINIKPVKIDMIIRQSDTKSY
jgi:polyphosphate kinase